MDNRREDGEIKSTREREGRRDTERVRQRIQAITSENHTWEQRKVDADRARKNKQKREPLFQYHGKKELRMLSHPQWQMRHKIQRD